MRHVLYLRSHNVLPPLETSGIALLKTTAYEGEIHGEAKCQGWKSFRKGVLKIVLPFFAKSYWAQAPSVKHISLKDKEGKETLNINSLRYFCRRISGCQTRKKLLFIMAPLIERCRIVENGTEQNLEDYNSVPLRCTMTNTTVVVLSTNSPLLMTTIWISNDTTQKMLYAFPCCLKSSVHLFPFTLCSCKGHSLTGIGSPWQMMFYCSMRCSL